MPVYVKAALPSPPFAVLTYELPEYLPASAFVPGSRAVAPLGGGYRAVVVIGPEEKAPEGVETRPLLWPLEREPLLGPEWMRMALSLSARLAEPVGQVLYGLLPKGLRSAQVRYVSRLAVAGAGRRRTFSPRDLAEAGPELLSTLAAAWEDGRLGVAARSEPDVCVRLLADPPWPLRPGAVRQTRILDYLYDSGPCGREHLFAALGPGHEPALRTLEERGLAAVGPWPDDAATAAKDAVPAASPLDALTPTPEQAEALEGLLAALAEGGGETRLLYGVTGSGKTYMYLRLIRECLASGRSALLLAPEVALALALHRAAREALPGAKVELYHGYMPPGRRETVFRDAAGPKPLLVVGTRSALFLPLRDPGLVIMDEEHDESFKQDERLVYQAKEVAWYRVNTSGGLLLLGSATPDVKTFHAATAGTMPLHRLTRRANEAALPAMELVDVSSLPASDGPFAPSVVERLSEVVAAGDQAVIMLNRRGWSPVMYCLSCEEAVACPNCRVSFTYHKARGRLVCHYCGLSVPFPSPCGKCGQTGFLPLGEGTEQLEDVLARILPPDTSIVRLDRDAARRRERMEAILTDFAAGRAQVMVGTQMLSKGHHFPGVTLVVVAEADRGLNLPDYRATERTFQLLTQVAGRAGRGEKPGSVMVQTRSPGHPFWDFVLRGDYEGFYAREIELRGRYGYPPFSRLGLLRLSHAVDDAGGAEVMTALSRALSEMAREKGIRLLGPAPAPLAHLHGRNRLQCLIKAESWLPIRELYVRARGLLPRGSDVRISLDLDPVSML